MKISPACWCPTMRTLGNPVKLTALMDSFRRQSLTIRVGRGVYSTARWDSAQHLFLLHNGSPATGGELWLESGKQGASVAEMKKNRQHRDSKWDHVTNRDGLGYDTVQADKQKSEMKRLWGWFLFNKDHLVRDFSNHLTKIRSSEYTLDNLKYPEWIVSIGIEWEENNFSVFTTCSVWLSIWNDKKFWKALLFFGDSISQWLLLSGLSGF